MSILFTDCRLLLRSEGVYSVMDGFLGVEGAYIDYIGKDRPKKGYSTEKRMGGALLMPGLVNAHGHAAMTLLRGVGSELPLQDWLFGKIIPIEDRMIADDIRWGTLYAVMEMLACGTTCFADMYSFTLEETEAIEDCGIKANICSLPLICGDPTLEAHECDRILKAAEYHRAIDARGEGRILSDFCVHSEYLSTEKTLGPYLEIARELGARIQIHISETEKEQLECIERHGCTPMEYFERSGALDNPVCAAHGVWLTDSDIEIAREKGVTVAHCPSSNMKLASGFAPVKKMLDMGVNVALGTDGCASNNNLNMFEEMHLAALIHKGDGREPSAVSPAAVLDMATINGAKAMGRPDCGRLEVGARADIVALNMNALHMRPALDIPALLCYSAQGSDVLMTMADGRILYKNGEFLTIDEEKVTAEFERCCGRLLG
ncbi:MAG: amidohydrolase [Clostridiales bacterium]|nr:amidohydrolase [Clostridiales bacterium]